MADTVVESTEPVKGHGLKINVFNVSREHEKVSGARLSVCLSVCLSVAHTQKK